MNNIHNKNSLDLSVFHRIDINLYPVFIAIYQQNSITQAAHLLCVSQSAVSHALQRLRLLLKDDLFVRHHQKMRPTPFAEQIYPHILQALALLQKLSEPQQSFNPSMVKSLRIAIHDEIEPLVFPKLFKHFQNLNLDIEFLSSKLDRKTVQTELVTQQIDFAIDLQQNYAHNIEFKTLIQDKFVVCSQQKNMNKQLYFAAKHVGVSSRRTGVLLEDSFIQQQNFSRELLLRCQHYSTALQILESNPNAVLTIPQEVLSHLSISNQICIFQHPLDLPLINIGMFWFKDLELNSRHTFLRNELLHVFKHFENKIT
ncbi:LysR family transcriptional regulator [Acinetobacter defluvii]|uniref:LysR family transcriptional regulator n=1 Tax=Acinetobacter defluvii TaxID=1871111 RepID=UPI00148F538B|nr:LysR family transcriptional regulator [Acinetobacter defluvii]NNP71396.1 LysR family transcriptional regulator [Acinetobacter defluvii]